MLKYCFSNGCPCDEEEACKQAAIGGNLDCVRFLFDKVKASRETEKEVALLAAGNGRIDILKYFVEERKISDAAKFDRVATAITYGKLDCLKYLVEEAKVPLNHWPYIANARYFEHPDCLNYLREKGCPEPTDEEYAEFFEDMRPKKAIKSVPAPPKSRAPKKVPVKKAPAKKKAVPKALAAKKAALKKYASGKLQHALQKVDLEDH